MPLTHFQCPDGETIDIGSCLQKCRMVHRCVSKPTLYAILSGRREWSGTPSTTQLLSGTRLEYLKTKVNYSTAPRDSAYALLGTAHHLKMQVATFDTEKQGADKDSLVTGIMDLLEEDEDNPGYHVITDYKTYGSFRVARLMGIKIKQEYSRTETYQRSGYWGKAGTPKKIKVPYHDPEAVDDFDEAMQLNHYRILLERQGYRISRMQLQITVRDGGLQVARERGVTERLYYPVVIRHIPDYEVETYFQNKAEALIQAITLDQLPPPCDERERWDGIKCRSYCEVADHCDVGIKEKVLHGS